MDKLLRIGGLAFDASQPIDISIPLNFNGPQPNAYGVKSATSIPCRAGTLVGDTRQGGSCNFEEYTFIPQCNGTHTECVGHLTNERISVRDCLQDAFVLACLITVKPTDAADADDTYIPGSQEADHVITERAISEALRSYAGKTCDALIIRTQPNGNDKLTQVYLDDPMPAYFTNDAMRSIVERGVKHLLVDLPSVDRLYDDGKLSNHRIFWNIEPGSCDVSNDTRSNATITELIYVPDQVVDGTYALNLQIAPFAADASPSRPILFRIQT